MQSTLVRITFLIVALGLGSWAVVTQWDQISGALVELSWQAVALGLALSLAHVFVMMCSWRALLSGLGHRLPLPDAVSVFSVGQLGKYIPGGVWNYLAAAELGADRKIPRATSVMALGLSTLVNILVALVLGCLVFVYAPNEVIQRFGALAWLIVPGAICLLPPVLNWLIRTVFRVARLGEPPKKLSATVLVAVVAYCLLAWTLAGAAMWILSVNLELTPSIDTFLMVVGVNSLAWAAGLLFLPAPSGVGVREAVAGLTLIGSLGGGAIGVVVIMSRILLVISDLIFGLVGFVIGRATARHRN